MAAAEGATPSASAVSNDSDTNGEQWWLPQPHPSLDEEHSEWRPAGPMAEALQCSVCKDLLKEAITAAECSHSYCYDCIDRVIQVGGKKNLCPVCDNLLGPNPWEHHKLKYDFMLDSLVRKVFPRPKLDAALEARRLEREEATRQAKAKLSRRNPKIGFARVSSSSQLAAAAAAPPKAGASPAGAAGPAAQQASGPAVEMLLHPLDLSSSNSSSGSQRLFELPHLPKPYLRVPPSVTLAVLKGFLTDRLVGKKGEASRLPPIVFKCAGQRLDDDGWTVQHVHDKVWKPSLTQNKGEVMVVHYAARSS